MTGRKNYRVWFVVQSLNCVWGFVTPWTTAHQASLSFTISQSLFKLMSIESVILFNYLIFYCPLLLLPSIFPNIRVFFSKLAPHIRWPKYYSLSFSISSFNEYSGLISFRIGWFVLLAVQGTLKSLFSTIQKHRHYCANKGPSSQGYWFSSGHVWMWELDCKEGWVPKN